MRDIKTERKIVTSERDKERKKDSKIEKNR